MRRFLTPIDMGKLEIVNLRIQNLASAPSSPVDGQVYYNTSDSTVYYYDADGTTWVAAKSGTGVPADGSITGGPAGAGVKIAADTITADNIAADAVGASELADNAVVNANIAAGAAIALSKLAVDPLARANHTGTQAASTISDLATVVKAYRLDEFAVPNVAVSFNDQRITNLGTPTTGTDAVTKAYVDGFSQGLDFKNSVRVATTANITLASALENGDTIDGVTLATNDRVLVKDQSTASENGIYSVNASGAPTRTADADSNGDISRGSVTYVEEGTANGGQQWVVSSTSAANWVPGTSGSTWTQFSGATTTSAGAGLTATGNVFAVGQGTGISVSADAVAIDTAVVTRKYTTSLTGGATSEVITHNLGTRNVSVTVRNNSSPWDSVDVDDEATSTNTVTVRAAANLPAGYTVLVLG